MNPAIQRFRDLFPIKAGRQPILTRTESKIFEHFILQEIEGARGEEEQKWRKLIKDNWENPLTLLDN